MTVTERQNKAKDLFTEGYNCAQALVLAFEEVFPLNREALAAIASSFGGGMGRMREICGAVSGMFAVAGLLYGYSDPNAKDEKAEHYARIRELADAFRKETGSILCRELLGETGIPASPVPDARTKEYYEKRPCADLVALAAGILQEYIEKHPLSERSRL